jgi:hypothetical protein
MSNQNTNEGNQPSSAPQPTNNPQQPNVSPQPTNLPPSPAEDPFALDRRLIGELQKAWSPPQTPVQQPETAPPPPTENK